MERVLSLRGVKLREFEGAAIASVVPPLTEVLREAVRLNLAGAILLFGEHYIEEIPQAIIEAAARKEFPLMTIPWDTPLVDIEESIARAIVLSDPAHGRSVFGLTEWVKGVIYAGASGNVPYVLGAYVVMFLVTACVAMLFTFAAACMVLVVAAFVVMSFTLAAAFVLVLCIFAATFMMVLHHRILM